MDYWGKYINFDNNKKYDISNISYDPNMSYGEYCALFGLDVDSVLAVCEFRHFQNCMSRNRQLGVYEREWLLAKHKR